MTYTATHINIHKLVLHPWRNAQVSLSRTISRSVANTQTKGYTGRFCHFALIHSAPSPAIFLPFMSSHPILSQSRISSPTNTDRTNASRSSGYLYSYACKMVLNSSYGTKIEYV